MARFLRQYDQKWFGTRQYSWHQGSGTWSGCTANFLHFSRIYRYNEQKVLLLKCISKNVDVHLKIKYTKMSISLHIIGRDWRNDGKVLSGHWQKDWGKTLTHQRHIWRRCNFDQLDKEVFKRVFIWGKEGSERNWGDFEKAGENLLKLHTLYKQGKKFQTLIMILSKI